LKILIATSEAVPFAKTGGLADVCGSLPIELEKLGHEPIVILPAHRQARSAGIPIEATGVDVGIPIGSKFVEGRILRSELPGSSVPVYLVDQPDYFDRAGLYQENGEDYRDNCERFVFFNRAVLEAIRGLNLHVDVLHANDWQTGLLPAYLKAEYRGVPGYEHIGSLFTIHNMAYQGVFWHWDMLLTGLDWKYFNWQQMEFFGNLNLLKTGLTFADRLNTVSPRYAEEIQSAPLGCGWKACCRAAATCCRASSMEWTIANGIPPMIPICRLNLGRTALPARPSARLACSKRWGCPCAREYRWLHLLGGWLSRRVLIYSHRWCATGCYRTTCNG